MHWTPILFASACWTLGFLLIEPGDLWAQSTGPKATGNLNLAYQYSGGTAPQFGFQARPLDYTSNSRIDVTYNKSRFAFILAKPTTYVAPGQPDKYYTAELIMPSVTARVGDLMPRFTDVTTGYARVSGGEGKLNFRKVVELRTIYGASKTAAPTRDFMIGSYAQRFVGQRIILNPVKRFTVGFSAVKMKDDVASVDFTESIYKPRASDNFVTGTDLTVYFLKRRGNFNVEYATSTYSDDLSAPADSSQIRYDSGAAHWLSRRTAAGRYVTVNDSTKTGEALSAKLVLPLATTRTTLDYRRVSRSFRTLSMPYALSDVDRYRVQHASTFFAKAMRVNFNGEYQEGNQSGTQAFTLHHLNLFGNVALEKTPVGRVTAGYRRNSRVNDAPMPEPRRADRRLNSVSKSPSVSVSRLLETGALSVNISGTVSAMWYADRIRPASEYRTYSFQLAGQTLATSRILVDSQVRYSESVRKISAVQRRAVEALLKNGYEISVQELQVYVIEGVYSTRSSDKREKSNQWTYGAGGTWSPDPASSISFEWMSRKQVDFLYSDYNYDQHTVELSLTYRW